MKRAWNKIVLILVLFVFCFTAGAYAAQDPLKLGISYTNINGEIITLEAQRLTYQGYENCWWVQIPYEADLYSLCLYAEDLSGTYVAFTPANGEVLQNVFNSGSDLTTARAVSIRAFRDNDTYGDELLLYISTDTAMPQQPVTVSWPQYVTVHYRGEDGSVIANDTTAQVYEGTNAVTAAPWDLQENWNLVGDSTQYVTAYADGTLDQSEITFTYRYQNPVSWPQYVTVHYRGEDGSVVANDTTTEVYEGTTPVTAAPWDLQANWNLVGDSTQYVTAYADGTLDKSEITFTYRYEEPVSWPQVVTVHYRGEDGSVVANDTTTEVYEGTTPVTAAPWDLQANWNLVGDSTQYVTAYADGTLDKSEINFTYRYEEPVSWPQVVTVHFRGEDGSVIANDTTAQVYEGTNAVSAAPWDLQENWNLVGDSTQYVTAYADGTLDQNEITFIYHYEEPVSWPVVITVHYRSEDGLTVASDTSFDIYEGINTVYPAPYDLQANWKPLDENDSENVTGYTDGTADKYEVTFVYYYEAPVSWPQYVTVHYMSDDGITRVASDTLSPVNEGVNYIYPEAADLTADYSPVEDGAYELVNADEFGNLDRSEIVFYYHYNAPVPQVEWPLYVTVHYISEEDGEKVADDIQYPVYEGKNDIIPAPQNLQENYVSSNDSLQVTAYADGTLSQAEVTFTYYYAAPAPTEPPVIIADQQITVRFVNEDGKAVASPYVVNCSAGETIIECSPADLQSGYVCIDDSPRIVVVDENGASMYEVLFIFRFIETPAPVTEAPTEVPTPVTEAPVTEAPATQAPVTPEPVPQYATIAVRYVNMDTGADFYSTPAMCTAGAESEIRVDMSIVSSNLGSGYELKSDERIIISVSQEGIASPAEAVFYFSAVTEAVNVYYRNENGMDIAAPVQVICREGDNTIVCEPQDLLPGYEPDLSRSGTTVVVTMTNGVLSPEYVVFWYKQIPQVTATPLPSYVIEEMDTYARPKSDTINFRSTPTTEVNDNKLRVVTRNDVAHITGVLVNWNNETWYRAEIDGVTGYLKDNVVNLLSAEEINEYMGITPTPVPATPTPAVTEAPVLTGYINLWGYSTVNSLNLRGEPRSNGKVIVQVNKKARVWVQEGKDIEGTLWYHVIYNNKEAWVMAKYIALYSQPESDDIQAKLSSPAPVLNDATPIVTVPPTYTPAPTAVQTEQPAETATPEPLQTATPAPYLGYALTVQRTALRSYQDAGDSGIITVLDENTLVLIVEQYWNDGELWDSVDVPSAGYEGYIQDRYLRHITNEEAKYYLDLINNQPTEVPVIATATPAPHTGYYITNGTVALRLFASDTAYIQTMLSQNTVCFVFEQSYNNGEAWDAVQVADMNGYVRADQIRAMTSYEIDSYLNSLRTATPEIQLITPAPVTEESDSSYGYINGNNVSLRSAAGTSAQRLAYLNQYTFVLLMGDTQVNGENWYHVMAEGREGYVSGKYLTVLKVNEIEAFLNSDVYAQSQAQATTQQSSSNIQSWEDYNINNSGAGSNATYVPFNPYTATPLPEVTAAPTMVPTETPFVQSTASPTSVPALINQTDAPGTAGTEKNASAGWIVPVLIIVVLIAGATGAYVYIMHRRNEKRREAIRAQQARQARKTAEMRQARPAQENASAAPTATFAENQTRQYMPYQGANPGRVYQTAQPSQMRSAQSTQPGSDQSRYAKPAAAAPAVNEAKPVAFENTASGAAQTASTDHYSAGINNAGANSSQYEAPAQNPIVRNRRSDRYKNQDGNQN